MAAHSGRPLAMATGSGSSISHFLVWDGRWPHSLRSRRLRGTARVTRSMGDLEIDQNVPLKRYCTWNIGGPAQALAVVKSAEDMSKAFRWAAVEDRPVFILGNGSNVLFDNRGFEGLVILNRIAHCEHLGDGFFSVGAGYPINKLSAQLSRSGWGGLEFAIGIPGTVGGAVYMNAGAHGQDTGGIVSSVRYFDGDGRLHTVDGACLQFGYRYSIFQQMERPVAIASITLSLMRCNRARQRATEYWRRRVLSQPAAARTAGCVFRNPGGGSISAGALIDQVGLKGRTFGGAAVSRRHANFFLNKCSCSSDDMLRLIDVVKREVLMHSGVKLFEEVVVVPAKS